MNHAIPATSHWESEQANIQEFCRYFLENSKIPPEIYLEHDVKRGLRNADGTGVLAGVTCIGSVQGYTLCDNDRVPCPGKLYYRGVSVEAVVDSFWQENRQGFAETVYLLLFGQLPNATQLEAFSQMLMRNSALPRNWGEDIFNKMPSNDIMNMLSRSVLALYACDPMADDNRLENMMRQCIRLIGVFPSIVASSYASIQGYYSKDVEEACQSLTPAQNILYRLRKDHRYTDEEARVLDLCMVLHAEHGGGNNSTFTCRVLSSSGTDTYSAIAGAVNSLKGNLHGGANARVCQMFKDIMCNLSNCHDENAVAEYLQKILRKEAGDGSGKIYGLGHAVYTESDPRVILLKNQARRLVACKAPEMQKEFALMELVERIGPRVFAESTGINKIISVNVDYYAGFIYRLLGIPEKMFTPLFAAARVSGWAAHRIEESLHGKRIIRPGYKAVELEKPLIPLKAR